MSKVNTDNKIEEEILSDKLIVAALNSADILVSIMKKDTTIVYLSKQHEKILLYKPEELIGKRGIELIHPEDKKRLLTKLAQYTKKFINLTLQNFLSGEIKSFSETVEYRVRDKAGNWHRLESVGTVIEGKIYNISKDITERKHAEQELAEQNKYSKVRAEVWKIASDKTLSEDQLIQKLLDIIGPAFGVSRACYNRFTGEDTYKSDLECVFEWCDKEAKPTVGEKLPPVLFKHFLMKNFSVLTPETALENIPQPQRIIIKPIITMLAKTQNIESVAIMPHYINNTVVGMLTFDICRNNKAKPVWTDEIASIIKEIVNIVSNHIAQKNAEFALAVANKYNQTRAEVWKIASDKTITENELIQKLLDIIGPAIGVSRACYNKFNGDDPFKNDLECILEWCDENAGPSIGTKMPAFLVKHFIQEDFFILTFENAFNFMPEKYRAIAKPLIKTITKTLKLESVLVLPHIVNDKLAGLLSFDVCTNKKVKPGWTDEIKSIVKEVVTIVTNHIIRKQAETELEKHRDNLEELVIKRSDELIKANRQLQNEITERKRTEDALQRAEKMETIGLMAGGVAHDLNNILAGIVSCPDMLLLELPQDSPLRELALAIRTSGLKASAVVQDLLLLSKGGFTPLEVICLNDVISEYQNSLEHEKLIGSRKDITFEISTGKNLMNISGSPIHLSKVIMNLVLNAAEAMPNGGTITILTKNEYIDRLLKGYETINENHYVVLSITDTGKGIPTKDLDRIFEPFYTKKIMNRSGTGLGLAIVWKTMKDHNGYIDVISAKNKGTRFDLYFPTTLKNIIPTNIPVPIEEYQSKGEKILVIDDNREQRNIAQKMLLKLGYKVITVKSGEDAVKHLKKNSADLLVMDMIMEDGIDGLETFRKIIKSNPAQKAIITSGFSETDRVKKAQNLGAGKYLKKPYTFESLGIAVREELDK